MAGPPAGFEGFLNQKYDIQRQEANARSNLLGAQTAAIPQTTAAEVGLQRAQAAETTARAGTIDPLAQASIAQTGANIGEAGARSGLYGAQASEIRNIDLASTPELALRLGYREQIQGGLNGVGGQAIGSYNGSTPAAGSAPGAPATGNPGGISRSGGFGNIISLDTPSTGGGSGFSDASAPGNGSGFQDVYAPRPRPVGGLKTGTTKVPGKGSGKVDTVPAMLAPGEAVLNKGAAEHVGRQNIEAANQIGLAKMGMKPKKYAGGTASVEPADDPEYYKNMATNPTLNEYKRQLNGDMRDFENNLGGSWAHNPGFAKGVSKVQPSNFYAKKGQAPLKPQTLANGTHTVMPGRSTPTGAPPKGLAAALAMLQTVGGQGGMPTPLGGPPLAAGAAPKGRGMK
jgi:hypothetical protein